jgi:polyferredoxin
MDINVEGILVIGCLFLLIGVLLYFPARLWAKHWIKKNPNSPGSRHITRAGLVFISLFLVILFAGYFSPYFMPNTLVSNLISTRIGRLIYFLVVVAIATPLERSLKARGFKLYVRKEARNA